MKMVKSFSKKWSFLKKMLLTAGVFLLSTSVVNAASLSLSPASEEFISGCESAVNIIVDTEGDVSNGADVFIEFDPNEIEIVDKDASIPGIQIQPGPVYELYFGDVDTGTGLIRSSAVSMFGNFNGSNGTYGTLVFKGKPGVTSASLSFQFVPGDSKDSNVAEFPTSDDLLTSVSGGTYTFRTGFCEVDAVPPRVQNESPQNGSRENPLDSNVTFNITDNLSGVDMDSVEVRIDGQAYGEGDAEFSYTGVPLDYDVVIDPSSNFQQDIPVFVEIDAKDLYGNVMPTYKFSFNHPIPDNDPPYIRNPSPAPGSRGVPLDSNLTFHVLDDLSGVDINTVVIEVDGETYQYGDPEFSFTGNLNDYYVSINPRNDFPDNTQITVSIDAVDLKGNVMTTYTYTFNQTIVDNSPPYVRNPKPAPNSRQVPVTTNLEFDVRDNFSGVDIDTVVVRADGETYDVNDPEFSYTGDPLNYHVVIDPRSDFPEGQEVTVKIDAIDLVGNIMPTYTYKFNEPAVCGDNVVELDFGEECEPPGTACCDSACMVVEAVEEVIEECPEIIPEPPAPEPEPECGNDIVEEGEECEPAGGVYCDDNCAWFDEEVEAYIEVLEDYQTEDFDNDSLVNIMERRFDTNLYNVDTDGDGMTDFEELLDFNTDPLIVDQADFRTKITNWKDGDVSGTGRLYVKGISHPTKKVQVYAIDKNEEEIYLGESYVDEEYKWGMLSDVELEEGEYFLRAEAYELDGVYIDESVLVKVIINYGDYFPAPVVETISDKPVLEGLSVEIFENQPIVFGRTEPDAQVFATFESILISSTILSDSIFGFFTLYAPRPLEVGEHTVTLYAVSPKGIRSDVVVVPFEILPTSPWYLKYWWIWLLLLILLVLIGSLSYWYYKKKKEEKELEEFETAEEEQYRKELEQAGEENIIHGIGEGRMWESEEIKKKKMGLDQAKEKAEKNKDNEAKKNDEVKKEDPYKDNSNNPDEGKS